MDSNYCEYHRFFSFNHIIKEEFITTENTDPKIHFHVSLRVEFSEWIIRQDSPEPEFVRVYEEPVLINHDFCVSCEQLSRIFIEQELIKVLTLEEVNLTRLVDYAWREASRSSVYLNYHHFNALYEHRCVILEEEASDYSFRMVPAEYSSIEGLKTIDYRRDMAEMSCCSVCLEDLSGGGDEGEEVLLLSMPCSHIFHGDCIKKWLRTSHYCPLCRFEMPTELDV
ncbi:hypothetical protein ABFS82_12G044100 [Erythranthe guttata]|nr:PREDICTED: RING-H2 finger protein ATL70-like [Erythranthe guttata]|eukprot:XP_012828833.1 PREDICTED: RING-H2 finger protein ATL70-like [Erythranthe guttata]